MEWFSDWRVLLAAGLLFVVAIMHLYPWLETRKITDQDKRLEHKIESRKSWSTVLGRVAVLVGLVFSVHQFNRVQEGLLEKSLLAEKRRVDIKFRKALVLLDGSGFITRFGGVVTLRQYAIETENFQLSADVIVGYLRSKISYTPAKLDTCRKASLKDHYSQVILELSKPLMHKLPVGSTCCR